jgi:hypothetical protein
MRAPAVTPTSIFSAKNDCPVSDSRGAILSGTFYWSTGKSGHVHIDDPRIKIGTGTNPNLGKLLDELQKDAERVLTLLPSDPHAKQILKDIEELRNKKNLK